MTKYDPDMALAIVERIADGELLKDICARNASPLMCSRATFLKWVATVPELSKAYAAAQSLSALSFEEEAIDKARRTATAPGNPQNVAAANLLVSQLRWSASRRNPGKYSDKGNLNIVVPVNISANLDLGSQNQSIDTEIPDLYTIRVQDRVTEAEYEEITDGTSALPEENEHAIETDDKLPSDQEPPSKEVLRSMLQTDRPVIGVSHQPLLATPSRKGDNFKQGAGKPRKRILIPGQRSPRFKSPFATKKGK